MLCDSCNADILEYESLEKRFDQLKERIITSFRENFTVNNLGNSNKTDKEIEFIEKNNQEVEPAEAEVDQLITQTDLNNITDLDLVEEIGDDEDEISRDIYSTAAEVNDALDVSEKQTEADNPSETTVSNIPYNFDFSAFNEHVAQNSLPPSVLNISDSLISLSIPDTGLEVENDNGKSK